MCDMCHEYDFADGYQDEYAVQLWVFDEDDILGFTRKSYDVCLHCLADYLFACLHGGSRFAGRVVHIKQFKTDYDGMATLVPNSAPLMVAP